MVTSTTIALTLRIVRSGKRTLRQQHQKERNMSTKVNPVNLINYYETFGEITQKEMQLDPNEKTMDSTRIEQNKILCSKKVMNNKSNVKNGSAMENYSSMSIECLDDLNKTLNSNVSKLKVITSCMYVLKCLICIYDTSDYEQYILE